MVELNLCSCARSGVLVIFFKLFSWSENKGVGLGFLF